MALSICDRTEAARLSGKPAFDKVIALGYQDGPTTGLVACVGNATAYRFDLLGVDVDGAYDRAAWDRGEELRVYGLAPLPAGAFERIVDTLAALERPRWPIWIPGVAAPDAEIQQRIEREVVPLLEAAGAPTLAVAGPGLLDPFRAAREIDSGAAPPRSDEEWFVMLGLPAPDAAGRDAVR